MLRHLLSILVVGNFLYKSSCLAQHNGTFSTIHENILSNYNKGIRPMPSIAGGQTLVQLSMRFRYLVELDERHQIFNALSWVHMNWTDNRLMWVPRDYNGIEEVVIKLNQIWWPNLIVYNDASRNFPVIGTYDIDYLDTVVDSSGLVSLTFPFVHVTFCGIHISHFPFDFQTCALRIGPSGVPRTILKVVIHPEDVFLDVVTRNGQWNIVSGRIFADEDDDESIFSQGGQDDVSSVVFEIELCRKPDYYILTIAMPASVIMIMALFVFLIPAESGERLSFIISLVLGVLIFQLFVEETLPVVSERPLLGIYVTCIFMAQVVLVPSSVVSMWLVFKTNRGVPAPRWIRYVAKFCRNYICFINDDNNDKSKASDKEDARSSSIPTGEVVGDISIISDRNIKKLPVDENVDIETSIDSWRIVANGLDIVLAAVTLVFIIASSIYLIVQSLAHNCFDYRDP